MSWDATATATVDGHEIELFDVNYTNNCNRMIREAGWPEWPHVGPIASPDLASKLVDVMAALTADRERFVAMNPENGWGSLTSLLDVLHGIWREAVKWPSATWTVTS